jgi:uncharacterized Zn-binding protein involved in type VI secretion
MDMTTHGTPLAGSPGSTDVLIGGQPAWRAVVDTHACPLSTGPQPHVGGTVVTGSSTVLINGYPAVRQGDVIVEHGPPNTIASGEPTVIIGGGSAPAAPPWAAALYERLSSYVDAHNEDVADADLGAAAGQLRNETVNLYVSADGGEAAFSFRTDGKNRIEGFQRGHREEATVRMETTRATVERLTNADAPAQAFREAILDDDISIRGIGTLNELKWRVLNGIKHLAAFFGGV